MKQKPYSLHTVSERKTKEKIKDLIFLKVIHNLESGIQLNTELSLLYYVSLIYAVVHVFIRHVKFQVLHDTILFCINGKSMGHNSFVI